MTDFELYKLCLKYGYHVNEDSCDNNEQIETYFRDNGRLKPNTILNMYIDIPEQLCDWYDEIYTSSISLTISRNYASETCISIYLYQFYDDIDIKNKNLPLINNINYECNVENINKDILIDIIKKNVLFAKKCKILYKKLNLDEEL